MDFQAARFNNNIVFAALVAVILGILIAFYYSYAQSQTHIGYLEKEKSLLVKDLTLMRDEVDRLSALYEVNEIELQDSRERVQQLLDSVSRLNINIAKLHQYRAEFRKIESRYDSLKLRNQDLQNNNVMLAGQNEESRTMIEELRGRNNTLTEAEAQLREENRELGQELRRKSYLQLSNPEGTGFRMRGDRPVRTGRAANIQKLRGCVTIKGNPNADAEEKVIYLQFLAPDMRIIEDNANTLTVQGNVYSKKVELLFMGIELNVCDFISVPEGSLVAGIYTLNVFEDERLLATTEFELK